MTDHYPGINAEPEDETAELRTRVARLQREHAQLKEALAYERREREALTKLLIPDQVGVRDQLAEQAKDLEFAKAAIDERMGELSRADLEVGKGTAQGIAEGMMPLLARMLGLIETGMTIDQQQAITLEALCLRVEALEAKRRAQEA